MSKDKVSVIVPVYNAEKYIDATIESILTQTHKNLELIIVDDGSTDSSASLCRDWQKKDNRVRYICQKNAGVSAARNNGLDKATGEYIVFCDADDWIDKEYIDDLISNASEHEVVISSFQQITEGGIKRRTYNLKDATASFSRRGFFDDCINGFIYTYTIWGKLFERSLIGNLRFRSLAYSEDAIFVRTILARCNSAVFINSTGYHYRINPDSVTVDISRIEEQSMGSLALVGHTLKICREQQEMSNISKKFDCMLRDTVESYLKVAIKNPIRKPSLSKRVLNEATLLLGKDDNRFWVKVHFLEILYRIKCLICPQLKINSI